MDSVLTIENFIDGKFVKADKHIDSYNPSTGEVWAKVPDSGADEVELAVSAAKRAFEMWSLKTIEERSNLLRKVADILESKLEEFAQVESRDQGKPIILSRVVDMPRAVHNFRFYSTAMLHELQQSSHLDKMDAINYVQRSPVGVAGLISPWNLPLYLLTFKIAPALITGNTVVAKPSEMTSVTAWMLCSVFQEAGIPPGVVNMVFGTGPKAGEALVKHPDVPIISFTGSTATAQKIRSVTSPYCKRLSLELGGKNAAVIFADADLESCLTTTIRSSFVNQGEVCLCTSRIFVQKPIYDKFVAQFVEKTKQIVVGDPFATNTTMGALISKEHLSKVKGYVAIAKEDGATLLCGEEQFELPSDNKDGYFMRPVVITNVLDKSRCMQEEIFGPVTCIVPFDDEEEVIARANNVIYGLCATVWSTDVGKVIRVSQKLKVGTVWANCWVIRDLNMPFGGCKESGIGREGLESLEFYTDAKTICIKY